MQAKRVSRAANQSLSPQATAASWVNISETIFHVFKCHFTAIAEGARREVEVLEAFSQRVVTFFVPNLEQTVLMNITHEVFLRRALPVSQIMLVSIE